MNQCKCGSDRVSLQKEIHVEDNGYRYTYFYVTCGFCKKKSPAVRHNAKEAIALWNKLSTKEVV